MDAYVGTSGFSYPEWRGRFYPDEIEPNGMLGYYATRLRSVEVNNTFYQMPKAELLERWALSVPEGFRFSLKAPRRISHVKRLKNAGEEVGYFLYAAENLGARLGPVLFQLPPFARKDKVLLEEFLASLPANVEAAFEFRHATWFEDDVFSVLEQKGAALCGGDADDGDRSPPLVKSAKFGYLRLRAPSYDAAGLDTWAERIRDKGFERAYVYLKHEVLGPLYAEYLAKRLAGGEPAPLAEGPVPVAEPEKKPKRARRKKAE